MKTKIKKQKTAFFARDKIVFIGMSGGVDSSVSAALLKSQGYKVVGVFIKTWHPDFIACNEEEERLDAMRVAAHLDIPFLTFDFEDVYKKEVADYMINEYKKGNTPNPDVMCNKEVKFGAFFKKAISMGADFVATGHYAQIKNCGTEINFIKGIDPSKDQSYFLWTLKKEQLSKILFPIGGLEKREVRLLAKKFKIPVAEKKDSQGICFLGIIDLKDFLKHYIKEQKGKVVNNNGVEIGHHDGVVFYTIGERHGFTITKKSPNDGAYYIVSKDIKKNILIVSQDKNIKKNDFTKDENRELIIHNINWISSVPKDHKNYTAQVRYHGEFLSCKIRTINNSGAIVVLNKSILVDSGQSCVVYDKDIVLGGGVIK
jgi:tRNA-specific 2-thiouridylase